MYHLKNKRVLLIVLCVVVVLGAALAAFLLWPKNKDDISTEPDTTLEATEAPAATDEPEADPTAETEDTEAAKVLPTFTITLENGGVLRGELYPDIAPQSVGNFVELANSGFYDGLIFHRVIPGFMIQGGDPKGTGTGGPGWNIKGEFAQNGITNDLQHTPGVLSMARSQQNDSAGSQFFIMVADSPHLNGAYAAFGLVKEGMEHADAIVATERNAQDRPLKDQVIQSIRVETNGVEYPFEKLSQ